MAWALLGAASGTPGVALPAFGGGGLKILGFFETTHAAPASSRVRVDIAEGLSKGGVRPEAFWISEAPQPYWIAQKSETRRSSTFIQWADSRRCEGLGVILASLTDPALQTPSPTGPQNGRLSRINMKPPQGALAVAVNARGGSDSASGRWIQASLQRLSACWSDAAPSDD